ncbi:ABC transporter permease subunit [Exiguobacterium sp. s162]|uniref:ABC transporter permease subunit n=1 Tax=Exiguobacterium sp. s162 TaxID=2751276 RepID=UPI001BEC4947|nr:ABC transporter permease subunit [Exiguobacterium sp. s162]
MNTASIFAVIQKDSKQIFRKKILLVTLIIVPLLIGLIIPSGVTWLITILNASVLQDPEILNLLDRFLTSIANSEVQQLSINEQLLYLFLNYPLVTLFLLVPVITCSVIASNSFVSEKEQNTLESLLFSPISIRDLFIAKLLISIIPAYLISIFCFGMNALIINMLITSRDFAVQFPSTQWWILMVLVLPILLTTTALINLVISTRVSTYQEAHNLSGLIILPVIGLMIAQLSGIFFIDSMFLLFLAGGLLLINGILLKYALRFGTRNQLFNSQMS